MSPCLPPYEMERRRLDREIPAAEADRWRERRPELAWGAGVEQAFDAVAPDAEPDIAESVHPRETYEHTP